MFCVILLVYGIEFPMALTSVCLLLSGSTLNTL